MRDLGKILQWRHQPHDCLLIRLFKAQIIAASKLHVSGLCEGNSPVTKRASNAENVSIWWRHHTGTKPQEAAIKHEMCAYFVGYTQDSKF